MLTDVYSFHSAKIQNSALVKGIKYYETGIRKILGNSLITPSENEFSKLAKGTTVERSFGSGLFPTTKPVRRMGGPKRADRPEVCRRGAHRRY